MSLAKDETNIFKLMRIIRNLSVKELAERLEVSPSSICLIESGKRNPGKRLLRDYAIELGVTPDFLGHHMNSGEKTERELRFEDHLFSVLREVIANDKKVNFSGLL